MLNLAQNANHSFTTSFVLPILCKICFDWSRAKVHCILGPFFSESLQPVFFTASTNGTAPYFYRKPLDAWWHGHPWFQESLSFPSRGNGSLMMLCDSDPKEGKGRDGLYICRSDSDSHAPPPLTWLHQQPCKVDANIDKVIKSLCGQVVHLDVNDFPAVEKISDQNSSGKDRFILAHNSKLQSLTLGSYSTGSLIQLLTLHFH